MEFSRNSGDMEVPLYDSNVEDPPAPTTLSKLTFHGYKDALFLALFGLSLLIVGAIALTYGTVSLVHPGADYWIINKDGMEMSDKANDDIVSKLMLGVLFILSLSTVLSLAWIYLLSYIAVFMVNAIIISLVVISVLGAVAVLSLGYPSFGFLLLIMALATLLVSLFFQSRIDFASVNLDIACKAIVAMPSTIGYSLLMLLLQALYVLVWCIAAIGFATNDYKVTKVFQGHEYVLDHCASYKYYGNFEVDSVSLSCAGGTCYACLCDSKLVSNSPCFTPRFYWTSMVGLVFALIWTNSVMVNVVHCTVIAAVSRWWMTGTCSVNSMQEFFGAFTSTSLGSICFGSLLGAVVRTARAVTGFIHARTKRTGNDNSILGRLNRWAASMIDYFLVLLDRIIVYFNRYAFCFVAIDEQDYISASFSAAALFRARGLTALFNDDLLDFVIYLSNVFIAIVSMIAAYIFAKVVKLPSVYLHLLVVFGFFCGFVMGAVVLSTISSAIIAVYVCFAKDPKAFESSHPALYPPLANAWNKIFPGSLQYSDNIRVQSQQKRNGIGNEAIGETIKNKKVTFYQNAAPSSSNTIRGSYGSSANSEGRTTDRSRSMSAGGDGAEGGNGGKGGIMSFVQMVQQNIGTVIAQANVGRSSGGYEAVSTTDPSSDISHGFREADGAEAGAGFANSPLHSHINQTASGRTTWGPSSVKAVGKKPEIESSMYSVPTEALSAFLFPNQHREQQRSTGDSQASYTSSLGSSQASLGYASRDRGYQPSQPFHEDEQVGLQEFGGL